MSVGSYIVVGPGGALELGSYEPQPQGGVLVRGEAATLFGSHKSATRAIERTVAYARREGLTMWPERHEYRIYRVTANPNARAQP